MSGDRDIRDALAEALWQGIAAPARLTWAELSESARHGWRRHADLLLAALPTVSLKIVREA